MKVTPLGAQYLATEPNSNAESRVLRLAIEGSAIIASIASDPFGSATREEVNAKLQSVYKLSPSTAKDRASTIMTWISQVSKRIGQSEGVEPTPQMAELCEPATDLKGNPTALRGAKNSKPGKVRAQKAPARKATTRKATTTKATTRTPKVWTPTTPAPTTPAPITRKATARKATVRRAKAGKEEGRRAPKLQKASSTKVTAPKTDVRRRGPIQADARTAGSDPSQVQPNSSLVSTPELRLPLSFEDARAIFPEEQLMQKLMDFVIPLEEDEERLMRHLLRARQSGRILFVLGHPGSGKSTFIESLGWRTHLGIRRKIHHLNASQSAGDLSAIAKEISTVAVAAKREQDMGPTVLVLEYLENLHGFNDDMVRGFYRMLNGILRNAPVLLLWPVVSKEDVVKMVQFSEGVSGTMFTRGEEILEFSGPPLDRYVSIAESTIGVVNNGRALTDFGLTRGDLEEALESIKKRPKHEQVIRKYLESIQDRWLELSGHLRKTIALIPKFSEVWFVICHEQAETLVNTFARRGDTADDAWLANHDALFQYVKDTQREGFWSARKLQMAINGVVKTRVLFITTNCAVAAIAAYGQPKVKELVLKNGGAMNWVQKARVQAYFRSTPLYRQLLGQSPLVGKRKSGPGREAIDKAGPAYKAINKWLSQGGSDHPLNNAVASMIKACIGEEFESVSVGKPHPWIPGVVPDIRLDPKSARRHICLEFHFTNNKQPGELASYCLRKLQTYIQQVESYIGRGKTSSRKAGRTTI